MGDCISRKGWKIWGSHCEQMNLEGSLRPELGATFIFRGHKSTRIFCRGRENAPQPCRSLGDSPQEELRALTSFLGCKEPRRRMGGDTLWKHPVEPGSYGQE